MLLGISSIDKYNGTRFSSALLFDLTKILEQPLSSSCCYPPWNVLIHPAGMMALGRLLRSPPIP